MNVRRILLLLAALTLTTNLAIGAYADLTSERLTLPQPSAPTQPKFEDIACCMVPPECPPFCPRG